MVSERVQRTAESAVQAHVAYLLEIRNDREWGIHGIADSVRLRKIDNGVSGINPWDSKGIYKDKQSVVGGVK